MLARAIAGSIDGVQFARIQCTPDLQPTDVTGLSVFNQKERDFEFRPGPVFANVLLVDEINRAMPKTQSALLEAMAEGQVTVDGETRGLPEPFILLATENPIEHEGTFPLPEAQLDRFFLRTALGYPGEEEELQIIRDQVDGHPLEHLRPVVTLAEVKELQTAVRGRLRGRPDPALDRRARPRDARARGVAIGASVRGTLALEHAARALALARGAGVRRARRRRPPDHAGALPPHRASRRCSSRDARRTGWDVAMTQFRDGNPRAGAAPGDARQRDRRRPGVSAAAASFPLVLRRRHVGLAFGATPSSRRGPGSDVAGSRPYRPATRCAGSTGLHPRACRPRAARTPSSSASASPTSHRASSSSPTAAPRWRSAHPISPG